MMDAVKLGFIGAILGVLFISTLQMSNRLWQIHLDLVRIEKVLRDK